MSKMDTKRGYCHISGGCGGAVYEQDGKFYDAQFNEVEFVESVTEDDIKAAEEAAEKAADKAAAKPVVTVKKAATAKASTKKAAKTPAPAAVAPESAVDAQIAAQGV